MNIKIIFLYDDIEKIIYMMQFTGFKIKNKENKVYKFIKTLYDLKQSFKI